MRNHLPAPLRQIPLPVPRTPSIAIETLSVGSCKRKIIPIYHGDLNLPFDRAVDVEGPGRGAFILCDPVVFPLVEVAHRLAAFLGVQVCDDCYVLPTLRALALRFPDEVRVAGCGGLSRNVTAVAERDGRRFLDFWNWRAGRLNASSGRRVTEEVRVIPRSLGGFNAHPQQQSKSISTFCDYHGQYDIL